MSTKPRLLPYLMGTGTFSRRWDAYDAIKAGRVIINGKIVKNPHYTVKKEALVFIDGKSVTAVRSLYLAVYKPKGVICQKSRKEERTILGIVLEQIKMGKQEFSSLFPIGRLDKDTTGLILITNDGKFQEQVASPDHLVAKTYIADLDREISSADKEKIEEGVMIPADFGYKREMFLAKGVVEKSQGNQVTLIITEGKKRQVRLMFLELGYKVTSLCRLSIGRLSLKDLGLTKEGMVKELSKKEAVLACQ
ncbi:rRNA pseudouridine synthase [Candidatus Woesearchaeota archaeon]|nr:MAG: 16S rRNA uridine-516 pseudouridylate synthase [archaeon GW2011_AR4]MBS3129213.1 rRNA pseudouridine synthase [Candidatus Woesearchaeota archaeon]HIH39028.1 rRNA pseudouridine synthase [Candidatus Woesearchaeota archaeon]HIH48335.1 rRNA pseudouridine synthase [Candidatus Woesearchaeota archaeon]HIJ04073.1 rRNA pseudouridine synthase [Candidatus Woesearchaeota archaeon]